MYQEDLGFYADVARRLKAGEEVIGSDILKLQMDEAANLRLSIQGASLEARLFDELAQFFKNFVNHDHKPVEGRTKYFALSALSRNYVVKSCANLMKQHTSDAFAAARIALEAAFYAYALALNVITENQYLDDPRTLRTC